jgi:hypothetical protein
MLPSTVGRVPRHTADEVNADIQRDLALNVSQYGRQGPDAIKRRLVELDHEWDIERTLEANAAAVSLMGLALGATVHRRWYVLPAMVAGFLLQHALQGWCPPLAVFRRLGVRTATEIDRERYALKAIRGDFPQTTQGNPEAALRAVHR